MGLAVTLLSSRPSIAAYDKATLRTVHLNETLSCNCRDRAPRR